MGCCLTLLDCACVLSACAGPTDVLGVCDAASSIGSSISSGVTGGVTSVMALFGAKGAGRGGPSVSVFVREGGAMKAFLGLQQLKPG